MRSFHFSLHAVRTLRQRQEQEALDAFGSAVRARQQAFDRREQAGQQLARAWNALEDLQADGAAAFRINQLRGHCCLLEEQVTRCAQDCATAQETANTAWEALQEARRQRELVEKLYVRRIEEHERLLRDEEQKQLDEMAGHRFLAQAVMTPPTAATWN